MLVQVLVAWCLLQTSFADQSLRGRQLPKNPVCELCRDGSLPRNPATRVVSLFFDGLKSCDELYVMGQQRYFENNVCVALQRFMDQPCGCFIFEAPSPITSFDDWSVSAPVVSPVSPIPPPPPVADTPKTPPTPITSSPVPAPTPQTVAGPTAPSWGFAYNSWWSPPTEQSPVAAPTATPQPPSPAPVQPPIPVPVPVPVPSTSAPVPVPTTDAPNTGPCEEKHRCINQHYGYAGYMMHINTPNWGCFEYCWQEFQLYDGGRQCGPCTASP